MEEQKESPRRAKLRGQKRRYSNWTSKAQLEFAKPRGQAWEFLQRKQQEGAGMSGDGGHPGMDTEAS